MLSKMPDSRLRKGFRRGLACSGFVVLAVFWVWLQYGGVSGLFRSGRCTWDHYTALRPSFRFAGFFDTSTVPQEILYTDSVNWVLRQEGGHAYLAAADPAQLAIIRVRLRKDFDTYVIFPRVAGGGAVSVAEATPDAVLFRLRGDANWTPLSRRYLLNLRCVTGGERRQQIPVDLVFILQGKNAQLWLNDEKLVFR